MKSLKYLLALAFAFFVIASVSSAQTATARLVGGGSSALFNELGSASQAITGTAAQTITCIWTKKKSTSVLVRDPRNGSTYDEQGNIWVAWSKGDGASPTCAAPTGNLDVYAYVQLDSVIGDRCFFLVDSSGVSGCQLIFSFPANTAGDSIISGLTDTNIPSAVVTAISNARFNLAGTDVRPEDAKFATVRMFTACNTLIPRQFFNQDSYFTSGLGYQTATPHIGTDIFEDPSAGTAVFHVLDFNIFGNDPQNTSQPVPAYQTYSIGAQPMIIGVSPISDTAGIGGASNINGFTLSLFQQGVLGRTTDLFGPTTTKAVDVYVREPLSGTYNVMEYSIPNGTQYHGSQDFANCNGSGTVSANPMGTGATTGYNIGVPSIGGVTPGRHRAIGTGHMTAALQAGSSTNNRLGYFFWSAGNASGLTNVKYLKVNGSDPLYSAAGTTYDGVLPGNDVGHPLTNVTFADLNAGNYPIWSVLRLVGPPSNTYVGLLLAGLNTITGSQHDFVPLSSLKVWHSHFFINNIGMSTAQAATGNTVSSANDLCTGSTAEGGGDAGGSIIPFAGNKDFCSDFSVAQGLLNKTQ